MSRAILLQGGSILPMSSQTPDLRIGSIGVVADRIAMVAYEDRAAEERFVEQYPDCEVIDCCGCVVMPGLINTHCHVSMTLMRNYADDMELMDWLNNHIWPFESRQTDEAIQAGARVGIAEMLLGGVTTFVDFYWSEYAIAKVVDQMGARALLCECVLDGREELFVESMDRLRSVAESSSRIDCGVAPHAPYTCSPAALAVARDYAARYDLPLTIHLDETKDEVEIIKERYGSTPWEYLCREGIITDRTILAHSIYLEPEEIAQLALSGASVAHNVQSNLKLASGIAPIAQMARAGVNCTIATDGASSNNDLDMWEEMRTAALLQRVKESCATVMPAYEVLRMATVGGAKAIGRGDELGFIAEGALADLIVVDTTKLHFQPHNNLVSALLYSAKASDVRYVVVNGDIVVRNGSLPNVDIQEICGEAQRFCDLLGGR